MQRTLLLIGGFEFDIEVTDIFGKPDCRIGNFGYNTWFRTNKAVNNKEYKNSKEMEKAVRLSMVKRGYKFIEWFCDIPTI